MAVIEIEGTTGGAAVVADSLQEEVATGSSAVTGSLSRILDLHGHVAGSGTASISDPQVVYGVAVVTGVMEVICVPYPICQTPRVPKCFRVGEQWGPGDLEICVTGTGGNPLGPVCISYTLYQIQHGCQPKQVGPSGRKPSNSSLGCYHATGTAGDCGQPGLWMIRWSYQESFGAGSVDKDCYFYVLDSVLCPVPGDTFGRACKYGWD